MVKSSKVDYVLFEVASFVCSKLPINLKCSSNIVEDKCVNPLHCIHNFTNLYHVPVKFTP